MLATFPNITPSRSGFVIQSSAVADYSRFNQVESIDEEAGAKWHVSLSWKFIKQTDLRLMRGFLNRHLNYGRFYLRDTAHKNLGKWGGNITVSGGNQDGEILLIKGATPNQLIAPICDRFTLGGFLYELTDDIYADSAGNALLRFMPEIRRVPANGAAIVHENPYGTFMLKNPSKMPTFSQNRLGARSVNLDIVEALR